MWEKFLSTLRSFWPSDVREDFYRGRVFRDASFCASCDLMVGVFAVIGQDAAQRMVELRSRREHYYLGEISVAYMDMEEWVDEEGKFCARTVNQLEKVLQEYCKVTHEDALWQDIQQRMAEFRRMKGIPADDSPEKLEEMGRIVSELLMSPEERLQRVIHELPTLRRLREMYQAEPQNGPGESCRSSSWMDIGLQLIGLRRRHSDCTPINVETIAHTGGDGHHFSLLRLDGRLTEESPVVVTLPSDGQSRVWADNLRDFLALGQRCGYGALVNGCKLDDQSHLEEPERRLLQRLARDLDLPSAEVAASRRRRASEKYSPLLKFADTFSLE